MRLRFLLAGILLAAASPPVTAAPLTFGVLNGVDDFSRATDIAACAPRSDQVEGAECRLARTSFGGLALDRASMTLNADGRAQAVEFLLDDSDFDLARQMLAGRYGRPSGDADAPVWAGFDDGARIAVRREGAQTRISFVFPANQAVAEASSETPAIVPVLLFLAAGLAAGVLLSRARRAAVPPRAPTMRETLERKLRESGGELHF
jgi:hypothetical protein